RISRSSTSARYGAPRCSASACAANTGSSIANASRKSIATAKRISSCFSARNLRALTKNIYRSSPRKRGGASVKARESADDMAGYGQTRFFSWRSAATTSKGNVRAHNEDSILDLPAAGLWVVADGMGGHNAGDVASRMIVESLAS